MAEWFIHIECDKLGLHREHKDGETQRCHCFCHPAPRTPEEQYRVEMLNVDYW